MGLSRGAGSQCSEFIAHSRQVLAEQAAVVATIFSDIKGFSGLGELLTATTLVKLLSTYFSEMTAAIHARNGIIDLPCAASARADLCGMRFLPARSAPDRGSQVRS